ncbi:unnamed protein product [Rhodiola kirilowii]
MAAGAVAKLLKNSANMFAASRNSEWYDVHMAAATRAVAGRINLVDLLLEIRDARIPMSSAYESLRNYPPSARRIIILNKTDLANKSQTQEWLKYFEQQGYTTYGLNSHNREHIQKFLNFLQSRIKEFKKTGNSSHTSTVLLVGVPNVGKSALSNSLHQVGRVSAKEKGKLRRATVSPLPGETKNISSMKVSSHPGIYILDTPGILPPNIPNDEVYAKLCLTGAIRDCMVQDNDLVQTFMGILNLNNDFMKWEKHSTRYLTDQDNLSTNIFKLETNETKKHPADHTQDCVVNDVREVFFDTISAVKGSIENEQSMSRLIEHQLILLKDAFRIHEESNEEGYRKLTMKLLNLCRSGRLGHYTLDSVPLNTL